jgi:hypothetical protein
MTTGEELTKRCSRCGEEKSSSHFGKARTRKDGLQRYCRPCQAEYEALRPKRSWTNEEVAAAKARAQARRDAKRIPAEVQRAWREANPEKLAAQRKKHYCAKYGMTPEEYDAKFAEQNGQCAICLIDLPSRPHIDHDHYNGLTRALLCQTCNLGLGMFLDNPALLERAAGYLEFWQVIHDAHEVPSETQ